MDKILPYAKFVVSIIGAGITSALSVTTAESPEYKWLVIASAVVTAVLVYAVPNKTANDPLTPRG